MSTFTNLDGPAILTELRSKLATANQELRSIALREDTPVEWRRKVRQDTVAKAQSLATEARTSFYQWAGKAEAAARAAYYADPVASAAEEVRRNTRELRLGRLIEAARANDQKLGPVVVPGAYGNTIVKNRTAHEYADKAMDAFLAARYEDAQLYGAASIEMGGPDRARQAFDGAQAQLDLANPARAKALGELRMVATARTVFERDVNAGIAEAFQSATAAAKAIGDDARSLAQSAVGPSLSAKLAAFAQSRASGEGYVDPLGTLPSGPAGMIHETDGMLNAKTSRTYGS